MGEESADPPYLEEIKLITVHCGCSLHAGEMFEVGGEPLETSAPLKQSNILRSVASLLLSPLQQYLKLFSNIHSSQRNLPQHKMKHRSILSMTASEPSLAYLVLNAIMNLPVGALVV